MIKLAVLKLCSQSCLERKENTLSGWFSWCNHACIGERHALLSVKTFSVTLGVNSNYA